jgi:hypothetical protein
VRQAVSFLLTAAAIAFLVRSFVENREELSAVEFDFSAANAVGLALFVLAVPVSGLLWGRVLSRLEHRAVPLPAAVWVHTKSWLLKYIPGQVGAAAGKLLWGSDHGYSKATIATSFGLENLFHLQASLSLSIPVVVVLSPTVSDRFSYLIAVWIMTQLLLFAGLAYLNRLSVPGLNSMSALSIRDVVYFEILYLIPRFMNAVGFVAIASAIVTLDDVGSAVLLGGTYVLAGIVGILAFLVPSGLGVREAVITLVLTPTFGAADALVLAATSRLLATTADVLLLVAYLAYGRRHLGATGPPRPSIRGT